MSSSDVGPQILLVDDDLAVLQAVSSMLEAGGLGPVRTCADPLQVGPLLRNEAVDVILLDLTMPGLSGEELQAWLVERHPDIPIIVISGNDAIETAVRCMHLGAADYLVKPVDSERLLAAVRRCREWREMHRLNDALRAAIAGAGPEDPAPFQGLITADATMLRLFRYVEAIARTRQPVLITGETGTGKELMARAVHAASGRAGPFVAVNVAGLDDHLFADSLFGHRKGAFTGADSARSGLVESAAGGTLFLDEIGDLAPASQVKLLRLLQEREFYPVGSDVPRRADARIVVATHRDVAALQQDGDFRRDLYYRLRAHHVALPPLRERRDDLPMLVRHFVAQAAAELGVAPPAVPEALDDLLAAYHFPGNVRELQALVQDAVGRHRGGPRLGLQAFHEAIGSTANGDAPPGDAAQPGQEDAVRFGERLPSLKEVQQLLVAEALHRTRGNQAAAASLLGISRQALNKRLNQHDASP